MDDAETVVLACRRLLCQTQEQARAALALCDGWLTKHSDQPEPVARKKPFLPTEIISAILRNFRGRDAESKDALRTCRLVNKAWNQIAWARLWYTVVEESAQSATRRFLHPSVWKIMKDVQVRKLIIEDHLGDLDFLLGAPMMSGVRVLQLPFDHTVSTSQLFLIFQSLPQLVVLSISVQNGPINWDCRDGEEGCRVVGMCKGKEFAVWKAGFGNLKALDISIEGKPVAEFDFRDVVEANLGTQLEFLGMADDNEERHETRLDSFCRKVVDKCPNFKGFDYSWPVLRPPRHFNQLLSRLVYLSLSTYADDMMKSVAATCAHLKYLDIYYDEEGLTHNSLWYLATGPFLRALSFHAAPGTDVMHWTDDEVIFLLKERGKSLELLNIDGQGTDRTLRAIEGFCPELRGHCIKFGTMTEAGIVAFLNGVRMLEQMDLPPRFRENEAIAKVAKEKNVTIDADFDFPTYIDLKAEGWMGW